MAGLSPRSVPPDLEQLHIAELGQARVPVPSRLHAGPGRGCPAQGCTRPLIPWRTPCRRPQSPRSPRNTFPTCRRWMASGLQPPPPASGMPGAPTCCWRCSTPVRAWPACSPARNAPRRRSTGAARKLKRGAARALVVNSGNANAFTGKSGRAATKLTAEIAATAAGCKPSDVLAGLHRRDRRAARGHEIRCRHGSARRQAVPVGGAPPPAPS